VENRRHSPGRRQMIDELKIVLTEDDIQKMSPDEKMNLLIKVAFANRNDLIGQGVLLTGNGSPEHGLCAKVAGISLHVKGLWLTMTGGGGIILGILLKHIIG